eukprot:m.128184 g.128184  ORF g.128184 m.128184 type:complete len:487 (+) comp9407_c1_seq5:201-1661(+)
MDFAMRSPPRPSRGDSGLSLVSPSHMLTVVLPGGPVDLSDSADTRETVHQLPRESLEDIVLALRDRVAQDSRGEARRPARRRSSLTLGRASFSVSTGSADDILGVSQAERMLEQIRQLQAQLDGATQEVADRDEIIEDLQAQLRDTEPSGESPAARSGKLRGSELELLGTLQERDRMLSEADSTLRGYADALRARDDLVQKTSRMLAAERRRVADLQAVYAAQARRLHEAEAAIAAMVAAGAPPPAAARADADADMLMLRCATCLQMIAADRLDVHAGECAAACRRLAETKQMLQVQVADPVATGGGELTVKVSALSRGRGLCRYAEGDADTNIFKKASELFRACALPPLSAGNGAHRHRRIWGRGVRGSPQRERLRVAAGRAAGPPPRQHRPAAECAPCGRAGRARPQSRRRRPAALPRPHRRTSGAAAKLARRRLSFREQRAAPRYGCAASPCRSACGRGGHACRAGPSAGPDQAHPRASPGRS